MTSKRANLSFVPLLLPNQTIYSWGAVFHEKSGNSTVDQTRLQLFGTARGRWHFHIPSHLNELCASTQLRLGTPEAIVRDATTIPYYTQFRDPSVVSSVLEQVRGNNSRGLARDLGMTRSAFNAHILRAGAAMNAFWPMKMSTDLHIGGEIINYLGYWFARSMAPHSWPYLMTEIQFTERYSYGRTMIGIRKTSNR